MRQVAEVARLEAMGQALEQEARAAKPLQRRLQSALDSAASRREAAAKDREASEAAKATAGPALHEALVARDTADADRGGYPYSYIESDWDDMYFAGRWALPINSNPYFIWFFQYVNK